MTKSPLARAAFWRTAPKGLSLSEMNTSKPSCIASSAICASSGLVGRNYNPVVSLSNHGLENNIRPSTSSGRRRGCGLHLLAVALRAAALDHLRVARQEEAERPEDEAGEHVAGHGGGGREPFLIGVVELHDAQQVEQADDQHQAGVLEEADEGADDAGDHHLQGLRQDDER